MPVDGFWSVSLYNAKGYYQQNQFIAYALNNVTVTKAADDSVTIQFGGCDGKITNCLPIMPGWNYMVRLYRPRPQNSQWKLEVSSRTTGAVGTKQVRPVVFTCSSNPRGTSAIGAKRTAGALGLLA